MSSASEEAEPRQEEAPTMVIEAPPNYEQTHELAQCPLCNSPNPILDMRLPVRWYEYFDINLYNCGTQCECHFGAERDPITDKITIKPHKHKFSVKHEILTDASHLK